LVLIQDTASDVFGTHTHTHTHTQLAAAKSKTDAQNKELKDLRTKVCVCGGGGGGACVERVSPCAREVSHSRTYVRRGRDLSA